MNARRFGRWLACSVLVLAGLDTCTAAEPLAPEVSVGQPVARMVTDYEGFTGRTAAAASVEIRARVTGYLIKVFFKDGSEVKQGDLLFEIDPRPYQAELEKAEASLALSEAHLKRAESAHKLATALVAKGAIDQREVEKIAGNRAEAEAGIRVARAGVDVAKLTLGFTKVVAPVAGRIGRRLLDPGNLVRADDTLLATIFSEEPMFVYFDTNEWTALRLRRLMREGKGKEDSGVPLMMGLSDEQGFPHRGMVDFIDNHVDPGAGTLRLRGIFANVNRLLLPGLSVRVRLPIGKPFHALLVPEKALGSDKGQAFLFVVNEKDKVEKRRVDIGPRPENLRVVRKGLQAEDWVVLGGPQELRPGMTVKPKKTAVSEEKPEEEPAPKNGKEQP